MGEFKRIGKMGHAGHTAGERLCGKSKAKTPMGKPKYRGSKVKYDGLEYRAWKKMDRFTYSKYEQVRSSSEYGSELSGSIEGIFWSG